MIYLPFAPLLDHATSCSDLAERTGVDVRTVYRWRKVGRVTLERADELAVKLGEHPAYIWPDDWDRAVAEDVAERSVECAAPDCTERWVPERKPGPTRKFCNARCRDRFHNARRPLSSGFPPRTCDECSTVFTPKPTARRPRFCSHRCKEANWQRTKYQTDSAFKAAKRKRIDNYKAEVRALRQKRKVA